MKVIITNDSLDSLLSIQISTNGGQSYSTYSVSSLKDGLTFDCSPKDLKVICDVNTLKYIQVLADGEKASSSDIDLSNYIKIKDIYVHCYKNPYYNHSSTDYEYLSDEEKEDIGSELEQQLYKNRYIEYYGYFEDLNDVSNLSEDVYLNFDRSGTIRFKDLFEHYLDYEDNKTYYGIDTDIGSDESELLGFLTVSGSSTYVSDEMPEAKNTGIFRINARIHFIKHF